MNTAEIQAINDKHIINTYGTRKLALDHGQGARLWDAEGREYLDFFAGIAVCNLGHCHPAVTRAIQVQAEKLVHVSNLYYIEPQVRLADLLSKHCFAPRWFFCNSGAEANEGAMKLARRYWAEKGTPKPEIVVAEQSFHGRTFAAITATGQPKYHVGFEPLLPGFHYVPYDDVDALAGAITSDVGAVLIEPIQGEGGVRVPGENYLAQVRELCNEKQVLLILDEVQTGMGRTGRLFAHQHAGIEPDILCLAKALANGVPIGAVGCTEEVATGFGVGSHASTFGGNPLASAAAFATLSEIVAPRFLDEVNAVAAHCMRGLRALAESHQSILEVRGRGLMIGVEFREKVAPLVQAMLDRGVICGPAGPNVLRFVPPLIISKDDVDCMMGHLEACLGELSW